MKQFSRPVLWIFFVIVLFEFDIVQTSYLEEIKWFNYDVDILQTPVKFDEAQELPVIQLTTKFGQKYQCLLPEVEDDELSEKTASNEKNTDIKELLMPMQTGPCLLKSKDWWTYEFCFGHYIKQFHIEDGKIIGQVMTLGLYEKDFDWDNQTDNERFRHVKQKYHSQTYSNGSKCDLTGQPRNAEVRIYCEEDAGDYIYRVDEPSSCSYIITIHTSRLCSHPQLRVLPSKKVHNIPCSPLLNEEQYSKYLQKLNREKMLAEEKRNQFLNVQQERLKIMKDSMNENAPPMKNAQMKVLGEAIIDTKKIDLQKFLQEAESNMKDDVETSDAKSKELADEEDKESILVMQEFDREIERLKAVVPPKDFASVKKELLRQFDKILNDFNVKLDFSQKRDNPDTRFTTNIKNLIEKLEQAEKDVNKANSDLKKARTAILGSETDGDERQQHSPSYPQTENVLENEQFKEGNFKVIEDENSQAAVLDDDKLHVRIRRLDRKSTDSSGKLYEMDFMQRRRLEQAVKEKLEKAGLDTGGRRIEVKIITAGYYDNEDGKDFHSLSEDETNQFQNMIMALLNGQQEAAQEMERHKKLEENYKFIWGNDASQDEDE